MLADNKDYPFHLLMEGEGLVSQAVSGSGFLVISQKKELPDTHMGRLDTIEALFPWNYTRSSISLCPAIGEVKLGFNKAKIRDGVQSVLSMLELVQCSISLSLLVSLLQSLGSSWSQAVEVNARKPREIQEHKRDHSFV